MESALQLYYVAMALYGWYCWRPAQSGIETREQSASLPIQRWPKVRHLFAVALICVASWLIGAVLATWSEAKLPYLDTWTTLGSLLATWMMARKVLENWLYWIVIDSVSIYLYWDRALYVTIGLFVVYIIVAWVGWRSWRAACVSQA